MGVRVGIKMRIADREVDTSALVNSGFETDTPQVIIPNKLLIKFGIKLDELGEYNKIEYDTAGGPIVMYVYPMSISLRVVVPDMKTNWIYADAVISPIEREVILSDATIEEFKIVILSPKSGYWRFRDDPPNKVRESAKPVYW